jgi:hypothetical protein
MKQELFDIIKDAKLYKHHRADQAIRAQLVNIKEACDLIDQYVWDLADEGVASGIHNTTSDIETLTIEIADELDALNQKNTQEQQ